jgi:collagenase-like PrtC family protease
MKLTVVVNNKNNTLEYKKIGAQAFIFALKDFSCGYENYFSLDDIKKVKEDNKDIEIFVSLNKNFFNDEIDKLEEVLIKLNDINIDGVLFYDMAVLRLRNKNKLKLDLVWDQTHMVTNYNTCNYYYDKGVKYGVVSKEITVDEIIEINDKTKMKLMTNVFGYPIMSYTRRSLVTNYYESSKIKDYDKHKIIVNNGEEYIINEEDYGTALYYGKLLNGSNIMDKINTDYLILNESFIDKDLFIKILTLFKKLNSKYDEKVAKEIDELVGDYRGFFFTKTIYKVKKND